MGSVNKSVSNIKHTNSSIIIISNLEIPEHQRVDNRPELSDFKSDEVHRLCDIVAFTHIPKCDYWSADYFDKKNTLEIIIAKSRKTNITGTVTLKFVNNTTNLAEVIDGVEGPND